MKNIFYCSNAHKELFSNNTRSNFNSYIDIIKEKEINGVPLFEIGKEFISGAQSSTDLESVIKANLEQ